MDCPRCHSDIADTVIECPHCRIQLRSHRVGPGSVLSSSGGNTLIILLIVIVIIGWWYSRNYHSNKPVAPAPTVEQQPAIDLNQMSSEEKALVEQGHSTQEQLEKINKLAGTVPGGREREQMVEDMDKPPEP